MHRIPGEISHLSGNWDRISELNRIIENHLPAGTFLDTSRIADWVGAINRYAGWRDARVPPLELLVAHAEAHADELHYHLVEQRSPTKPAGIVLSGSPKMLCNVLDEPAIQHTLGIIRWALEEQIPILGICFGMHMLAYERFETMAEWLHVPEGMGVEVHPSRDEKARFTTVQPGAKSGVFGRSRIIRTPGGEDQPVMNAAGRKWGLEVHWQFIDPAMLPKKCVLAMSRRLYRPNRNVGQEHGCEQRMAEVFSAGPVAIGTQLHPELQPWLLYVLSHFREHEKALVAEGHNLTAIRDGLLKHGGGIYTGQRVGYNWVKRMMVLAYIRYLERFIGHHKAQVLRQRIMDRNPHIPI